MKIPFYKRKKLQQMNKLIYYLFLVMLFATSGITAQAQSITIGEVEAGPGAVSVPVYMEDFTNVEGFQLAFTFDPQILTGFNGIENRFVTGPDIIWVPQSGDGIVIVTFMDFAMNSYDIDEKVFDLKFIFAGGYDVDIEFDLDKTEIMAGGDIVDNDDVTFINGAVVTDPELIAGTVSMETVEDVVPDQVYEMPVTMEGEGFTAIEVIDLKVGFNDDQLIYEEVVLNENLDFDFVQISLEGDGQLRIMLTSDTAIDLSDLGEPIANIKFTYTAVTEAEVHFLSGTEISAPAGPLAIEMVNGVFIPMEFDVKLTIPHVYQYSGADVEIPVELSGIDDEFPNVGSISLRIGYDNDIMEYAGYDSEYSDQWTIGGTDPLIMELVITEEGGMELEDETDLITLRFNFVDVGYTHVNLLDGSTLKSPLGVTLPFTPVNGSAEVSVSGSVYEALIDARENTMLEVTNPETNEVMAVTTYPDEFMEFIEEGGFTVPALTDDWMVDAQFMSEEIIPAGTMIHLFYGAAEFHIEIAEDVPAGHKLFLSDMILEADPEAIVRTVLLDHAGLEETWHIEIRSPLTYETTLHVAVITDDGDFSASEDGEWNGFVLAHDDVEMTVYGDPQLIFALNGVDVATGFEEEFCHNEDVVATLSEVVVGEEPLTIEFTVNGIEHVLEDLFEGDVIWPTEAHPEGVEPGTYDIVITSIVDNVGRYVIDPEEIYYGTVVIHPVPAVEISFNDVVVPVDDELHILDNEPVTVTLDQIDPGTGPVSLVWTLDDGDPVAWEGNAGDVIVEIDELPAGEYHWKLTMLADVNCEVENPEEIYYLHIVVDVSIVDVATLAELRAMPDDETVYRYTGEAVLVAQGDFRGRKFIQDETAAILIDDGPGVITTEYELYDVLTNVVGKLNDFFGFLQYQPQENTEPAIDNTPVDPAVFLPGDVTMDDQAKLIKLENMTFVDVDDGDVFENGEDYVITDGVDEFVLMTYLYGVVDGMEIPHGPVNLTGVIVYDWNELKIVPRFPDDIEVLVYNVTFVVEDEGGDAITDAVITLGDMTNDPGDYVFEDIVPGDYDYTVTADGYWPAEGTVSVVDDHVTETVTLILEAYTVTFVVEDEEGDAITDAVITLGDMTNAAGDYVFEEIVPGDYNYTVTADDYWPEDGTVSVVDDDVEEHVVMEIDDTSIADTELSTLTLYPNPARTTLNIVSDGSVIEEIRAVDMLGQVVYSASVQDYRYEINVSGFRNGVYFIQVTTPEGLQTHRVQVTR